MTNQGSETMPRRSGRVELRGLALDPIHHGQGVAGNTQLIRMQPVITDDGRQVRVPFISGNAVKGRLRRAMVEFALIAMRAENTFSKAEIDLLCSGGHLSSGGAAIDLGICREIEQVFPALSLCGYSAGNRMTESKLSITHMHVACEENRWRMPVDVQRNHMARALALVGTEFGTRKDVGSSDLGQRFLKAADQKLLEDKAAKKRGTKVAHERDEQSAQMIYEFQCIAAGARLFGSISYREVTEMEHAAMLSGFVQLTSETLPAIDVGGNAGPQYVWSLGGKAAVGFGRIAMTMIMQERPSPVEYRTQAMVLQGTGANWAHPYISHLQSRSRDIVELIQRAVK